MEHLIGKGTKYINSAVFLPVINITGEDEILFEVRSPVIPQANEVCFPGGRIDKTTDESAEETVIRETMEELCISRDKIEIKGFIGTLVAPIGTTIDAYWGLININSTDELKVNSREVQNIFSVPLQWFRDNAPETYEIRVEIYPYEIDRKGDKRFILPVKELGLPEIYHDKWMGRNLPVYFYRTEKGLIWGITAEIVKEFTSLNLSSC